jgi:flagellar basal-body rod protein FlgG
MMRSLWIAKSGMEAQQTQLDHISQNLANSGTNGYKQSHAVFEDLIYQNLRQSGANSSEQTQLPAVATSRQFSQGTLTQTSNNLDMAIQGKGFFQVTMPDGTTGYTRDGSFQMDAQGQIVTNNGYVLQPGITVPSTATNLSIGTDGTVTASIPGQVALQNLGQIQLATFVNPAGLDPKGQNLFAETTASGAPQTSAPTVQGMGSLSQGFVESSNVNVVQELVSMIQTQRAYELNSKAIQTSDQMLQKLGQI